MANLQQLLRRLKRERIKPLAAFRAMRALIKNPDDTGQVFRVIEALKGDSIGASVRRLRASPEGCALLSDKPAIVPVLNDKQALLAMPEGSIGRAYYDFVHGEHLSADGLVAASEAAPRHLDLSDDERWLGERMRDIHDLQHVMTGYGRDPVGELCLLSFMTQQTPNRGINFIIFMGRQEYRNKMPDVTIDDLVSEGRLIGLNAEWMAKIRWEARLHESLDAVREELGFNTPAQYLDYLRGPNVATSAAGSATNQAA